MAKLGGTRPDGNLKKASQGRGILPRLICSSVLFMLSLPAPPTQLLPISLISSFCLSPGSSSSCWKHAQVSFILNKALLDLMLSPISFSVHSLLNTHNSMGTALQDPLIGLTSLSFTFEHLFVRIPLRVLMVDGALSSALNVHRLQGNPITFVF